MERLAALSDAQELPPTAEVVAGGDDGLGQQ
jgi:hypothetical protein